MKFQILIVAAAIVAAPTSAVAKPQANAKAPVETAQAKPSVDPAEAMQAMTKMYDRFFPAGPEPDPARLGLARNASLTMFPNGTLAESMTGFMAGTAERVLDMSEADFAAMMPPPKLKKGEKAKTPSTERLRVTLARKNPNFDAELAAGMAFAKVMMTKFAAAAEPSFREGMARSMARKFDNRQLGEIQAFLATPTGAAYGRQMVALWFEPDVIRGSFKAPPEIMKMMPGVVKDAAAFDAQMKSKGKGIPANKGGATGTPVG